MSFLNKIFKKKKSTKETKLEFLCVVLNCWLISIGTSLIVDAQFSFQIGILSILWQTIVAIAAAVLFTRRWWIPIIYFGILVPVFFLAISLSGDITTFLQSVASFIKWWSSGMPYASKWYSDQGFYLVNTITNMAIGVLYFAVARIFKKAWLVVAVSVGFIIQSYSYGHTGYNPVAFLFLLAGIFPLIAGEKFQNVKLPDVKNRFGVFGKKWLLVLVSTFLVTVILVTSFAVANNTKGSVRNRFNSNLVADMQTVADTYTNEQKKLSLSLFDLGLVTNSNYVGGNLYNIKPKVLATTNLTKPTLIKMTTFDTFDGVMWKNDFEKSYRINSFWDYEQKSYLAGTAVSNPEFLEELSTVAEKSEVTFVLSEDSNFLPSVSQVIGFTENSDTINPVLYNKSSGLFSYYGFKKGYTYTIDALIYDTSQKVLNTQLKRIENSFGFEEDPLYDKNCEFYKDYTQLPSQVPESLKTVVANMNFENATVYEKAYKICEFFSSKGNFVYSRQGNVFKHDDNIIQKLFETKKGHCLYFSTAMVIMAREAGIPSRLAAGYQTVSSSGNAYQIIDSSSPFAWVECYIPNIGWISFNPSPAENIKYNNSNKNEVLNTNQTPSIKVDTETEKEDQHSVGTYTKRKNTFNIPFLILLSLVVLAIICIILNAIFSQRFYEIEKVRKRFKTTVKQTKFYYNDMLRQFYWLGFKFKKGETLRELTNRICEKLSPDDAKKLLKAIKTVEKLNYGDIAPTDEAVIGVFEARTQLEKALMEKNNKLFYTFKRRLLLPVFSFSLKKHR